MDHGASGGYLTLRSDSTCTGATIPTTTGSVTIAPTHTTRPGPGMVAVTTITTAAFALLRDRTLLGAGPWPAVHSPVAPAEREVVVIWTAALEYEAERMVVQAIRARGQWSVPDGLVAPRRPKGLPRAHGLLAALSPAIVPPVIRWARHALPHAPLLLEREQPPAA